MRQLPGVGKAVGVGVPPAVVGVGAAVGPPQERVAVEVGLPPERQAGVLTPGQCVAAIVRQRRVEFVERGRQHVQHKAVAQGDVVRVLFAPDDAHGDQTNVGDDARAPGPDHHRTGDGPTFLDGDVRAFGDEGLHRLVDAGLVQRDRIADGGGLDDEDVRLPGGLPLVAHLLQVKVAVNVGFFRLDDVTERGFLHVAVGELPPVRHGLPVRRNQRCAVFPARDDGFAGGE